MLYSSIEPQVRFLSWSVPEHHPASSSTLAVHVSITSKKIHLYLDRQMFQNLKFLPKSQPESLFNSFSLKTLIPGLESSIKLETRQAAGVARLPGRWQTRKPWTPPGMCR